MDIPREIISKIAEARYIMRSRADVDGDPQSDWRFAERAYDFFEDDNKTKDCWYEMEFDEFRDYAAIYYTMKGLNNDRQST